MKIGVAVDNYKKTIFEKHLSAAGFKYEVSQLFDKAILFTVVTDDRYGLGKVVKEANDECKNRN